MFKQTQWKKYTPDSKTGKLCYQYCSKKSHLPIRDILDDHKDGNKEEPNYETATYNWYRECNQRSVKAAVNDKLSHLLFITRYAGLRQEYRDRYFIVGYYEIGWTAKIGTCVAVRARKICFVPVDKAYEITNERWQAINPGHTTHISNLRQATQRISGELLDEIINHLDKSNAIDDFLREAARLKAEYIPFPADSIPPGRIFIINVGTNTANTLQSPAFDDRTFEFVPIPEEMPVKAPTFAELQQFNVPGKSLMELFPQSPVFSAIAHNDPEFMTFTYGDNIKHKGNLQALEKDDYLFFLARLVPYANGQFDKQGAFFALVGYLEIAERLDDPASSLFTSPAFARNAHIRRWRDDPASFENFSVFKGSTNSRRFQYAVPFNRDFVESMPLHLANGEAWDWTRTTELGVIGSNTRTVRMYIDPKTEAERGQAERFWEYIWKAQIKAVRAVKGAQKSCCGCT